MKLFLDTEFTDFLDGLDLISIALVSDSGQEFYAELSSFDESACNAFVRSTVLPLLFKSPEAICASKSELRARLEAWFLSFNQDVTIMYDCFTDYALLMDLFGNELPWYARESIAIEKRLDPERLESYFADESVIRHHALHDARGNKFSFINSTRP